MKERIKQRIGDIGFACLVAFVAGLIGYGCGIWHERECEPIEQYDATAFDTPPTEAINPSYGAVAIDWNGEHLVINHITWREKTGANDEYSEHSSNECGTSGR